MDYLAAKTKDSPRKEFIYVNDDGQIVAMRYDAWKAVFLENRAMASAALTTVGWRGIPTEIARFQCNCRSQVPMPVLIMKHTGYSVLAAALIWAGAASAATNSYSLDYRPGPADNPLKGFLPYAGNYTTFPHSMEWGYLPLRSLMTGPTNFD